MTNAPKASPSEATAHQTDSRPRVTVSVVCCRDDQFLVVEERVGGHAVLNLPGGHLDPGETLVQAARREALEETGWQVEIDALVGIYQWHAQHRNRRYVRFVFTATASTQPHPEPAEPGILAVRWFTIEQLHKKADRLRSPVILTILDDYQNQQRFPLSLLGAGNRL